MRILSALLFLFAAASSGAELTPLLEHGRVGVVIQDLAFPGKLDRDLTSGLTNRILVRVTLTDQARAPAAQRAVEIAVRYDLWEEHFITTTSLDGAAGQAQTISTLADVKAMLRRIRLPALFEPAEPARSFVLTADVLLNPIDRERMEMIRKWVAENSIGVGDVEGRTSGDSMSVLIFNRIFEQYSKGADVASVWRETLSSRPFRTHEIADERR